MNNPSTLSQLVGLVAFGIASYVAHCGFRWIHTQAERSWENSRPTVHQRAIRQVGRFLEWMGYTK